MKFHFNSGAEGKGKIMMRVKLGRSRLPTAAALDMLHTNLHSQNVVFCLMFPSFAIHS